MKICNVRKHLSGGGHASGIIRCSKDLIGKKVLIRILTDEEVKEIMLKQIKRNNEN